MDRKWLNPNQMRYRVKSARQILGDMQPRQLIDLLRELDVLEEILADLGATEEMAAAVPTEDKDALAEAAILNGLKRGDMAVVKMYQEQRMRAEATQAFQVEVNITDYRIADASLKRIVLEATADVVGEILDAAVERSEVDGCPPEKWMPLANAIYAWKVWAEDGLKPRKTDA